MDLALVRMQGDGLLPEAQRRNYRNVGHALVSVVRDDGPKGLLAGVGPTISRAMAVNFGMLAFNASAKDMLRDAGVSDFNAVLGASAIAAFASAVCGLPFDFVKTQIQNQVTKRTPMECVMETVREGGVLRFYAGFPTFYVRVAPHIMITLVVQDWIRRKQERYGF
jgi:solute carrier family 25 oxoglutarate transporter 11